MPIDVLSNRTVVRNAYPMGDLNINVVMEKVLIDEVNALMDLGWVVLSTWFEDETATTVWDTMITDVRFRLAKGTMRIILTTDVPMPMATDILVNIDADDPGSTAEIITNIRQPIQKLRTVSILGYSPVTTRGLGMTISTEMPKLSVIGLDVEVTTYLRGGNMLLPYDPIISIVISNGGWYDKEFDDKCYCIYAFGVCKTIKWPDGRNAMVIKVDNSECAVRKAYRIVNILCPNFVNFYNGFNFDLRCLLASNALDLFISETFFERRLGNVRVGIF
ncbi:hypothetical protein CIB48_g10296 [Xylaria polymorpha]|nr:hypothetical protein CIB48_g10296 [Xylaria polymorpha]